jgi:hypothetical protein
MQNELANPVEFKLIDLTGTAYQWVENSDVAVWADALVNNAATQINSTKNGFTNDLFKKDQEFAFRKFDAKVISKQVKAALVA